MVEAVMDEEKKKVGETRDTVLGEAAAGTPGDDSSCETKVSREASDA